MSRIVFVLSVMAGLFILTGCSESPQDVAGKWGEAILKGDLKTANHYSTEKTRTINAFVISLLDGDSEKVNSAREKFEEGVKKVETAKVVIEGDVAKIYTEGDESKPMTLKQVDGEWKVDAQK